MHSLSIELFRFKRIIDRTLNIISDDTLKSRHFVVLTLILQNNLIRQCDISKLSGLDRTSTMKIVDELQDKNFIRRTHSKNIVVQNFLEITPASRQWHKRYVAQASANEKLLSPLSHAEKVSLRTTLEGLPIEITDLRPPNLDMFF